MIGLRRKILGGAGGTAVVVMAAFSAPAQSASPYTMPANAPADSRAAAPDPVQAPVQIDQPEVSDAMMAPPATPLSPVNLPQIPAKERKNWTEMTPEEIFGLPAPKKKPVDSTQPGSFDAAKHLSSGSPLADFLAEQRRANGHGENADGSPDNASFWGVGAAIPNARRLGTEGDRPAADTLLTQLLQTTRTTISSQDYSSEWAGILQNPQSTAPTPQQQADMEAFREMLNPALAPEKPKSAASEDNSLKTPGTDPDVEPVSPKYHPNGSTYAPLDSGIGRPKRLDPLPTATGGSSSVAPATRPAWAPQPPPWTVTTPQLFVVPQRHF